LLPIVLNASELSNRDCCATRRVDRLPTRHTRPKLPRSCHLAAGSGQRSSSDHRTEILRRLSSHGVVAWLSIVLLLVVDGGRSISARFGYAGPVHRRDPLEASSGGLSDIIPAHRVREARPFQACRRSSVRQQEPDRP
jgi:hypothetical protein